MPSRSLSELTHDDFVVDFSVISNPRALHHALRKSQQVKNLKNEIGSGELTDESIRQFVATLLKNLEYGSRFPNELALAAIAVALETRPTTFAEEFILDLARLNLAEIPIAIRVARIAARERAKMSASKSKTFRWPATESASPEWQCVQESRQVSVSHTYESFSF